MLFYDDIKKAMGVEIAISTDMANAILLWNKMYTNEAPWLSEKNGIRSCELPSAICSEMATSVTMEAKIEVSGSSRAEAINKALKTVKNDLSTLVEYACAGGGIILKPYVAKNNIAVDYVLSNNFFPVEFNSAKKITAAIFPEYKQKGKWLYTRLEYHSFDEANKTYLIRNKAFKSQKAAVKVNDIINLGTEVSLTEISEWEELEPEVLLQNATCPLFSYFPIPIANNTDLHSPLGVSLYSRAVNHIRDADEQYGGVLWEYRSKETAVQAGTEFFEKDRNGNTKLPKGKERLYHDLGDVTDKTGTPFFNVFSPEIRDQSFFNGFNRILQRIEFNSRLAYGTLSDPQTVEKTAEEIKSGKQRSYATVTAIQNSLHNALEDLVQAIDAWMTIGNLTPQGTWELKADFDDSLIVDKAKEREEDRKDVSMGAMSLIEYRAKWRGETLTQAALNLPQQASLIPDDLQKEKPEIKAMNAAQMRGIISIMSEFAAGKVPESQAVYLLSKAAGIEKDEARQLLKGDVV